MKLPGYYSSGEFAKKAHITKKTVRYYDEHNILKPSYVNENGARFYNDDDFARLQQILFLKYLGFSLDDIKEMTLRNTDSNVMSESLHMQLGLVEERIEQMKLMKSALQEASEVIDEGRGLEPYAGAGQYKRDGAKAKTAVQGCFKYISQNQSAQGFLNESGELV